MFLLFLQIKKGPVPKIIYCLRPITTIQLEWMWHVLGVHKSVSKLLNFQCPTDSFWRFFKFKLQFVFFKLENKSFIWHQDCKDFRLFWWRYQLLKFWPKFYFPDCNSRLLLLSQILLKSITTATATATAGQAAWVEDGWGLAYWVGLVEVEAGWGWGTVY